MCGCIFNYFDKNQWIDIIGIIFTVLAIFTSYFIAERSFKQQQNAKDFQEKILSENEVKLLKESLKDLIIPIETVNEKINDSKDNGFYFINTDPDLNANFLKFINLNRIYHSEIDQIYLLNKIIQCLSKIDTFNDTLEVETKKFSERRFILDNEYKSILKELELQRIKINNLFKYDERSATINKVPIEEQFQFELQKLQVFIDNNEEIRTLKQLELKKAFLDLFIRKVLNLTREFSFRESREMGLICLSLITKYDEILDHEKHYMRLLIGYSDFLEKSKSKINSYIT